MAGTADYQEEVLSNLLDLQAELRGELRDGAAEVMPDVSDGAPAPVDVTVDEGPEAGPPDPDVVTVATSGLQVSVAPTSAAVTERLAALNQRLSRLEDELANVARRIEDVEPEPETPTEPAVDVDARWRSFIDLQRIVADRLDGR
jgi:hypothetical protein